MIKILVVEDEFLMRERLSKTIDWASIGCEIIGCAENGLEAEMIIHKDIPDIVVTDIKMPKMDGLELCQFIHTNYGFIKVIIMTGYGEFSYAQKALQLGVKDYILKPSDKQGILATVKRVSDMVRKEKEVYENQEKLNAVILENLTYIRTKIFDDILNGDTFRIEEQNKKLGDIIRNNGIYAILSIEGKGNEAFGQYSQIKNAIEEFNRSISYDYIVSITNGLLYIILFFPDTYSTSNIRLELREYAVKLQNYLKEEHGIYISIGISRYCIDIAELAGAFREAEKRLKAASFFSNGDIVVQVNEQDELEGRVTSYPLHDINSLLNLLKSGEKELIAENIAAFFRELSASKDCTGEYIKNVCIDIIILCSNLLNEHNKTLDVILAGEVNIYTILSKLGTLQDVVSWMTNFLLQVMQIVAEKQKPTGKKYIEEALNFINNNYMHDISLAKTADYVHVHPVHLGRVLRKELGENFSDIVLKVRIENAKKLLGDPNKKTYEVASSVGINDSHYFSQLFKKYTGLTPTEYKESL